ncbi:helix-turn-helix domain-containing protein [Prevotella copri]|uniref:Helix-turn-helix domain-containing protein n=2 Tax=Segatella copri TaxID=165179 RepID=A0AAW4MXQ0_9BACT|nr:helix-turn-helix domain-containing protein [Segatella copri]MBV3394494.1 helix-turn-helix domain-containing protein [Segatella copri]MBV3404298.1 helix-turn-helix domain-containing protein [Segatella copri]
MFRQGISFQVPIPITRTLKAMMWQLIGSIFLFFILIGCLYYLVKTIVFQKRIDGIRHEFLKNMIYELKQPKEDDKGEESAVFIGSIAFYYAQNELQCCNSRVVITSRQAEILKLLAENQNQLVERDFILNEVWGDDSYSNSLALNVQITYLRRALNLDEKVSIEAVIKKGYILRTC